MRNELQTMEPAAKVLAATAISNSLSFCMERKYLQGIDREEAFCLEASTPAASNTAAWIKL